MKKCDSCTSCGMPLRTAEDHATGKETFPFCTHCAGPDGVLKSYEEVLEGTAGYFATSQGIDPQAARRMAEQLLKKQPAWINRK